MTKPNTLEQLRAQKEKADQSRTDESALREIEKMKSMMVRDSRTISTPDNMPAQGQIQYTRKVVNETTASVVDASNIRSVLPDIELITQIVISQILSPKDMVTVSLLYKAGSAKLGDVNASLVKIVKDYLEDDYKIKDRCPEILRRALFETGSYPISVIPRTTIDQVINNAGRMSREDYSRYMDDKQRARPLGILGNRTRSSFANESNAVINDSQQIGSKDWNISISDNPDVFKIKHLVDKRRNDLIMEAYDLNRSELSVENKDATKQVIRDKMQRASLYNNRAYNLNTVLDLTNIETKTHAADDEGSPLVIVWPSESVVTVHPPGDVNTPIGYFVACDQYGSPIKAVGVQDYYHQFNRNINQQADQGGNILNRMAQTMQGSYTIHDKASIDEMLPIFSKVIENELIDRLSSGVVGANAVLSYPEEFYRLMFMRACQEMQTQLIFIPENLMTYFAFDYNQHGIGISLLEKTKTIASFRALIEVSNILTAVKNSTNYRKLHVDLNPNTADPQKDIETAINEFARQTQMGFPLGVLNPLDLSDYIARYGVQVSWSGHPRMPESNISVENLSGSIADINTELSENLFKQHCWGLGCPPELVDSSTGVDYAAQIHQSNLMFVKRGIVLQQTFASHLTDHIQKYCSLSGELMIKLKKCINENRDKLSESGIKESNTDEAIALHFINNLSISLPQPDFSMLNSQIEQFNSYGSAIDQTIDVILNSSYMGEDFKTQLGKLGGSVDNMANSLKAHFKRVWLQDRGILSEVFSLLSDNDNGTLMKQFVTSNASHADDVRNMILAHISEMIKANKRTDSLLDKVEALGSTDGSSSSSSSDSGSTDFNAGGDSDSTDFGSAEDSKAVGEAEDAFAAFDKASGGDDKSDGGGGDDDAFASFEG